MEEGIAQFLDNPLYRANNPDLQNPVDLEVEENWDNDTPRENVNNQTPTENHQSTWFNCRQRYLQKRRERRRQNRREKNQYSY